LSRNEFIIGYRCFNKLGGFIKIQKDKNTFMDNNVIYKISCMDYDASYVGKQKEN